MVYFGILNQLSTLIQVCIWFLSNLLDNQPVIVIEYFRFMVLSFSDKKILKTR